MSVIEVHPRHNTALDVVIAVAGINPSSAFADVKDMDINALRDIFDVNTFAFVRLFNAVYPLLKASASPPKLLAISSNASQIVEMEPTIPVKVGVYGASKAALNYLVRRAHFENPWLTFRNGGLKSGSYIINSVFGLGADRVLEWEVVTAGGQHLVASPVKNSDLYWALSDGGGGTYAAIISMTVRAHHLTKVSVATLNFTTSTNVSTDLFNSAVQTFLLTLPSLGEAGTWSSWLLATGVFSLRPIASPDLDKDQLQALLKPTLSFLDNNGIPYDYQIQQYSTFLEAYTGMFPVDNITEYNIGGRLIPKSLLETNSSTASFLDAINFITSQGGVVSGNSLDVSGFPSTGVNNSVNPVWRTTILNIVFGLQVLPAYNACDFQANIALQNEITNTLMPRLEALTPSSRVYLNEGDFRDPNWKTNFYGANYASSLSIKDKYDPNSLFYGLTAVGSDRWTVQPDGRLCRTS
ncbi:uncharacterized protein F4817DRAFT_363693 [Daldinia loculata]|uniref:uncharacterized protein n=1 Tax=Daldinia loculata TaxID=103429 RepID=UPI0020C27522|nr:uncharacterized protein F4817DRAFT_363693 [Daldinia loculata]KAI1649359.1 hypothetical protein F4817DRAFT_363693 [Daldinia loculata]